MKRFLPLVLAVAIPASLTACSSDKQHDVTVSWSDVRQTIDGFGASSAFFGANLSDAQADLLFDAKKGIGLSLLRTMIGVPDDTQDDGSQPTTGTLTAPAAPELATAQQAVARGTKVWATAWTPPPIWKTTNNKNGSGTDYKSNKLQPEHYQDYATYLADFVDLLAKANPPVSLLGISPANEPDYTASWDGAQWTPDELATFVGKNLGPTLAQRFPSVKIIAPDTASWPSCDKYVTPMLADAATKGYLSIVATHPYSNGNTAPDLTYNVPQKNGKSFWESEWSQENSKGDTPDPTMVSAIDLAKHIHDHMVISNMNAWSWWALYINNDGLKDNPTRQNPAFIQPDATKGDPYMFKRGYAFGNWSKFVRPGFKRIGATDKPGGGVLVEAYRDDTHLALLAINTGSSPVTQKFVASGGSFGTLTPWVTSPSDSLVAKSPINATDSFTYELPAMSVVTFVNWDANAETPGLENLPPVGADGGTDGPPRTTGLDCSAALVPNNLVNGGVTDFTDWKGSSGTWGTNAGLFGNIYSYKGPNGSTMNATVDTAAKNLHVTGSVTQGDYGGAGLSFSVCTTVQSFSKVQFTLAGSSPGCDLELQMKTFDQQPVSQTPAGGCPADAPGGCYNFPVVKQVATPTTAPMTVVVPLASFTNWSPQNAGQVVGMQWQFTGVSLEADSGVGCPIDVTITGVKFLP